jgi:hypothetical protein
MSSSLFIGLHIRPVAKEQIIPGVYHLSTIQGRMLIDMQSNEFIVDR